jgi:hypothetical protein
LGVERVGGVGGGGSGVSVTLMMRVGGSKTVGGRAIFALMTSAMTTM